MEAVMQPKRIHAVWPTWSVGLGLGLAFLGERVLVANGTARGALAIVSGLLIFAALGMRTKELAAASPEKKPVAKALFLATIGVVLGLGLYLPLAKGLLPEDAKTARAALFVLFPMVLALAFAPMVAIELAVASVAYIDRYESRRIARAVERALALALLLTALGLGNYLADRHDEKLDLSQGQKARTSEQTARMLRETTDEVKITLFFPKANEVAEAIDPYFESVKALAPSVTLTGLPWADYTGG